MNAPDKIYLHGYDFDREPCVKWDKEPRAKGMRGYPVVNVEYIRKSALLEWAKRNQDECGLVIEDDIWQEVIDRISEL